jgi:hypothetical protein
MRLLKTVLYLVLSLCLIWGATVTIGPALISFALSRSFSDKQLSFTGLAISPKLQISASRVAFDFSDKGNQLYGAVRAPKIKIYPSTDGWLVHLSSGLLQVNDTVNLSALKADFRTNSLINLNAGQFSFSTPEISSAEDFVFSGVNLSSYVDVSSSEWSNLKYEAKAARLKDMRSGDVFLIDALEGALSKLSANQKWQDQILDFTLRAETSEVQSVQFGKVKLQSFLLEAENDGGIFNGSLNVQSVELVDNGIFLEGITANPVIDPIALTFHEEIRVEINQGSFEQKAPNKLSGNFKDLEALVGLHVPKRFLQLTSNVTDLEIWNAQIPLITVPHLELEISANISTIGHTQDASADFKGSLDRGDGPVLTGEVVSKLYSQDGRDCLTVICAMSGILIGIKYEFDGEQVTGKGSCPSGLCGDETSSLMIETSNTPKIVMGLTKQKIVNPLALVMFSGGVMQGQEVGLGHKIQF